MHIAQNWRLKAQRYALKGVRCETCGNAVFPPREVCPHCANNNSAQSNDKEAEILVFPEIQQPARLPRAGR